MPQVVDRRNADNSLSVQLKNFLGVLDIAHIWVVRRVKIPPFRFAVWGLASIHKLAMLMVFSLKRNV